MSPSPATPPAPAWPVAASLKLLWVQRLHLQDTARNSTTQPQHNAAQQTPQVERELDERPCWKDAVVAVCKAKSCHTAAKLRQAVGFGSHMSLLTLVFLHLLPTLAAACLL